VVEFLGIYGLFHGIGSEVYYIMFLPQFHIFSLVAYIISNWVKIGVLTAAHF
jgi:hypothetical protein